ncbi:uncharacterized protein G2W53_033187 [Senna tora]|uniref:Uncharacterized protein n=1 Tax=Senna tora TaxID=362788 RepID=A0A834WAS7_9FABA|nr:uncharacterized protein G2W53_033187 [Senna tora]
MAMDMAVIFVAELMNELLVGGMHHFAPANSKGFTIFPMGYGHSVTWSNGVSVVMYCHTVQSAFLVPIFPSLSLLSHLSLSLVAEEAPQDPVDFEAHISDLEAPRCSSPMVSLHWQIILWTKREKRLLMRTALAFKMCRFLYTFR